MTDNAVSDYRLLRAILLLDSILRGGLGLLSIVAADVVAGLLGLEQLNARLWLRAFGFLLVVYGALLLWASVQRHVSRWVTGAALLLNIGWVVGATLLLATDALKLSSNGVTLMVAITAAVALLAASEYIGLQRLP